jgi:hypothetical protein
MTLVRDLRRRQACHQATGDQGDVATPSRRLGSNEHWILIIGGDLMAGRGLAGPDSPFSLDTASIMSRPATPAQ